MNETMKPDGFFYYSLEKKNDLVANFVNSSARYILRKNKRIVSCILLLL